MKGTCVADLSDGLLFAAVLIYGLAMLAFAAASAGARARRVSAAATPERVLVGAGGPAVVETPVPAAAPSWTRAAQLAVAATAIGWVVHLGSVIARGFAADRVPWGNMYEFSSAVALVGVTGFLVLLARRKVDVSVGPFVMVPVVLYLGLAGTVLYTEAGPLVPALNSYWIKIHVFAAILASGAFMLSGVISALYLLRNRHDETVARLATPDPGTRTTMVLRKERPVALQFPFTLGRSLPPAEKLDRAAYAVIAFAFPVWTFAIIAGAIWAEAAWGRYWGWDPKETWSFITWVLYAGYLHARATAGWKGSKAAWVSLAASAALIIDYYVVNIFVVGLHSYA
jgi:cytochrome c-type biogenesis protein CcsB